MKFLLAGVAALALGALLAAEHRHPLRRGTRPKARRDARNALMAAAGLLAVRVVESPVVEPLAETVERRRWGLVQAFDLPRWGRDLLAVLLMDYTLYLWHVATHRWGFLWRFHLIHHTDLDLSASTALRFHFAELALSTPWRAGQIALIGTGPRALHLWQKLLLASIFFHHSNLRLPPAWDKYLSRVVVTPSLHGIHHSARHSHTNSNWSSGLVVWDWLHGTLRRDVPQETIIIGVPAYRDPAELRLGRLLAMPFGRERDAWREFSWSYSSGRGMAFSNI